MIWLCCTFSSTLWVVHQQGPGVMPTIPPCTLAWQTKTPYTRTDTAKIMEYHELWSVDCLESLQGRFTWYHQEHKTKVWDYEITTFTHVPQNIFPQISTDWRLGGTTCKKTFITELVALHRQLNWIHLLMRLLGKKYCAYPNPGLKKKNEEPECAFSKSLTA